MSEAALSKLIPEFCTDEASVYDSEKISVWCYPAHRIVHHQMHRFCHGPMFRQALEAGRLALLQSRGIGWLSDDRATGALPPEDADWARIMWFPRAKAAGWKYWAMVKPVAIVGQMNVKRIVENFQTQGVVASYFTEVSPAVSWLLEHCANDR